MPGISLQARVDSLDSFRTCVSSESSTGLCPTLQREIQGALGGQAIAE